MIQKNRHFYGHGGGLCVGDRASCFRVMKDVGGQTEDKQAVLLSAETSVWSGVSEESSREREKESEWASLLTLWSVHPGGAFHVHRI